MTCQTLFSGKTKKKIVNLSSAGLAWRVIKVNTLLGLILNSYVNIEIHEHTVTDSFFS